MMGQVNEQNLVARHNGNTSAVKHGLHARAELLAPEARRPLRGVVERASKTPNRETAAACVRKHWRPSPYGGSRWNYLGSR
jgi:hypothetical protein